MNRACTPYFNPRCLSPLRYLLQQLLQKWLGKVQIIFWSLLLKANCFGKHLIMRFPYCCKQRKTQNFGIIFSPNIRKSFGTEKMRLLYAWMPSNVMTLGVELNLGWSQKAKVTRLVHNTKQNFRKLDFKTKEQVIVDLIKSLQFKSSLFERNSRSFQEPGIIKHWSRKLSFSGPQRLSPKLIFAKRSKSYRVLHLAHSCTAFFYFTMFVIEYPVMTAILT